MQATEKIWMNGDLVDWDDARIHVGVHGLHYGTGVFEGIRCYDTPKGPAVFRLTDHMQRLHNSARLIDMTLPYSVEDLRDATNDLLGANGLTECYIRPIAFYGYGQLGVSARDNPIDTVIMSWPWGTYLGEEALASGIRAKISSWQRIPPNVVPHAAKASGVYLNSMLAVNEARRSGYDEAILLTPEGNVADGPGETIFVVSKGKIYTPDLSTGILHGITRDSIVQIANDLGSRGRREESDPLRPVSRRRGLHVRHGRRGHSAPLRRRSRDRRRPGDARAAEGVSRHGQGRERSLGAVAGARAEHDARLSV